MRPRFPITIKYILNSMSKHSQVLKELKQELEVFRISGYKQWYVIYLPEDGDVLEYYFIKDKRIVQKILESVQVFDSQSFRFNDKEKVIEAFLTKCLYDTVNIQMKTKTTQINTAKSDQVSLLNIDKSPKFQQFIMELGDEASIKI